MAAIPELNASLVKTEHLVEYALGGYYGPSH